MSLRGATILLLAILLIAAAISLLAALLNWEWFFRSENTRALTGRLKRPYTRLIYAIIAVAAIALVITIARDISAL